MKKMISLAFACMICIASYAQKFTFGPRVGVSQSKMIIKQNASNGQYDSGEGVFGLHAGVFTRFSGSMFYVQPEVLFSATGSKVTFSSNNNTTKEIREYKYNKIDVPVMFGIRLGAVRFQAGPVASLILKADVKSGDTTDDVKENYKDTRIGYQAGIGFDISRLILDVKYEGSLGEYTNNIAGQPTDQRTSAILLSLGFKIFN